MRILRSQTASAGLLLLAAVLGLVLANTGIGPSLGHAQHAQLGALSVGEWISDGLLAVFFFTVAVELKYEMVSGELASLKRALRPALAAACGVAAPALLYLAIAGGESPSGWPIPTATDIAFALGVLAVFGRGLPSRLRVFLMAFAVLDDLIAIVIIAVLFTSFVNWWLLLLAAVGVAAFAGLARGLHGFWRVPMGMLMILIAIGVWWCVYGSGIHATIAGVALGLAMPLRSSTLTRHALEPWVNCIVLPLFALSAALVKVPSVGFAGLSPAFWGILIALPVGKVVGITLGGWLGDLTMRDPEHPPWSLAALLTLGALGGIGFTVSLLMTELAFPHHGTLTAEGTLAVLLGSGLSLIAAALAVSFLARTHRACLAPAPASDLSSIHEQPPL